MLSVFKNERLRYVRYQNSSKTEIKTILLCLYGIEHSLRLVNDIRILPSYPSVCPHPRFTLTPFESCSCGTQVLACRVAVCYKQLRVQPKQGFLDGAFCSKSCPWTGEKVFHCDKVSASLFKSYLTFIYKYCINIEFAYLCVQ